MFAAKRNGLCRSLVAWAGDEQVSSAVLTIDPGAENLGVRKTNPGQGIGLGITSKRQIFSTTTCDRVDDQTASLMATEIDEIPIKRW